LPDKLQGGAGHPGEHVELGGATMQQVDQGVLELILVVSHSYSRYPRRTYTARHVPEYGHHLAHTLYGEYHVEDLPLPFTCHTWAMCVSETAFNSHKGVDVYGWKIGSGGP
jgi:hypothetical protein